MSSFKMNAKHKKTGEIHSVWCLDDYFGHHIYGYIPNIEGGEVMKVEEFERLYEPQPPTKEADDERQD